MIEGFIVIMCFTILSIIALIVKIPLVKLLFGIMDLIVASLITNTYLYPFANIMIAFLGIFNIYACAISLRR